LPSQPGQKDGDANGDDIYYEIASSKDIKY
jgi:hypothetical protein